MRVRCRAAPRCGARLRCCDGLLRVRTLQGVEIRRCCGACGENARFTLKSTLATPTVLVVDDDTISRQLAVETLRRAGHVVCDAGDGAEAMHRLESGPVPVVVSDLVMPNLGGLDLLAWIRQHHPAIEVIIMTGHGEVETAVQAMRLGAFDYVTKPFHPEKLVHLVGRALERRQLLNQTCALRQQLEAQHGLETIVGNDPGIQKLRDRVALAAACDHTVLVTGETGTGKELVARALHHISPRRLKPFVTVNCAALPEALIASELFGHERGSFTSAIRSRVGRFEAADGGTLLLDEIGDLPPSTQGTLLRVLQEKRFERVGSSKSLDVDVRVVAATKQDLEQAVHQGRFREDLYFRLNVLTVACPPLRERYADIPLLVEHFLNSLQDRRPDKAPLALTRCGLAKLMTYHWPGNVRELENVLTRAAVLARGRQIDSDDLEFTICDQETNVAAESLRMQDVERDHVLRVLEKHTWNRTDAARALGMDRSTLLRKIVQYRLSPPR
jgi:DNA-binding NtrC family response regulator